jgi:hypothetical protein
MTRTLNPPRHPQEAVSDPALKRPKLRSDQHDGADDAQPCTRSVSTEPGAPQQPAAGAATARGDPEASLQDPESEAGLLNQAQAQPDASTSGSAPTAEAQPPAPAVAKLPLLSAMLAGPDDFFTPRENVIGSDVGTVGDQGQQQAAASEQGQAAPRLQEEVVVAAASCVGYCSVQNNRPYQEDRAKVLLDHGTILGGMFDGHAGLCTSTFLQVSAQRPPGVPPTASATSSLILQRSRERQFY